MPTKKPAPQKKPAAAKPAAPKKPASQKPAPAKKTATSKKPTPPKKAPAQEKTPAQKKKAPAPTPVSKRASLAGGRAAAPTIVRLRVLCVAGPYWDSDDTCLRAIDVPEGISLYDLHAAILESIHFEEHEESVFTYFIARDYRGRRTYLGDGEPLTSETDIELFEDIALSTVLPTDGKSFLYYVFDADDPWVFLIGREPEPRVPSPHEFYPLVRDDLAIGPDPIQHGDGLDDFADADEGAEFNDLRREFRHQRRVREESGLDDDELEDAEDDDSTVVPDIFATDDDTDDFFDEDDEENRNPYASDYDNDDNW